MQDCLKYLYIEYFLAVKGLGSLKFLACHIKTMAPSEDHIKAYLAMSCSNPSNGEGEPHTPNTPPRGGTLHHLQVELGDLTNDELHQLIEDLTQEIAQCGVNVPPSSPPPNTWVSPLGSRDPEEDDSEVTFPGGGGWGLLRQPTPSTEPE